MQRKNNSPFFLVEKVQVDLSLGSGSSNKTRLPRYLIGRSRGRGGFVSVAIRGRGDGPMYVYVMYNKNE